MSISENVRFYLEKIKAGNCFGEPVTLVAATKTRTADEINEAIGAGIADIGENKVQEFRDKYDLVKGGNRHFIGHLQTNKVKYLIGKTCLVHSLDRDELAEELAKRSQRAGVTTDALPHVVRCFPVRRWRSNCSRGSMAPLSASEKSSILYALSDTARSNRSSAVLTGGRAGSAFAARSNASPERISSSGVFAGYRQDSPWIWKSLSNRAQCLCDA